MPNPNLNPIPEGFGRVIGRILHYNSEAGVTVPLPFAEVSFWPSTKRKIIGQQSGIPFPLFTGAPIMASSDENGYIIGPDERFGVDLIASDGPTDPTGFTWNVRVNAPGSTPRVWSIWVPEGETTDLFKTEPIPPNLGQQIIRWEEVRRQVYAARDETFEARDETLLARDETLAAIVGIDDKVNQAGVYADLSEEFALRSEAAALRSEGFSGDSERYAQDSQNAAGISQNWAERAEEESERAETEADRSGVFASQSKASAQEAAALVAGALGAVDDAEGFANQAREYRDEAGDYAGAAQTAAAGALNSEANASAHAQASAASASNSAAAAVASQNSATASSTSAAAAGTSAANAAASATTSQTAASAAAQSAANSLAYSEDSLVSATASQESAEASEASRQAAESAEAQALASAATAQAARDESQAAASSAQGSATAAESSAILAGTLANAAGESADSAAVSATESEASAVSSGESAALAEGSALEAASSATAAATSAQQAAESASASQGGATSAESSAQAAATSASAALASESAAQNHADNAASSSQEASQAASAALTSASDSQSSATAAASSAQNAENSATSAESSASEAETSALAADGFASEAQGYAEAAEQSATNSATSATASETSRVASETARDAASTSASQAQTAQAGAETAEQNAMLSAEEAESSATAAGLSATSAEISAAEAEASAASMLTQGRLTFDEETGRYTNASIRGFLSARSTPRPYGVSVPKGLATVCTKTGANAGIANPVPGIIGTSAVDPYTSHSPFFTLEVNGGVEIDGTPFVTAVKGDANFKRDGSNGDVWILAPVLFWRFGEVTGEEEMKLEISDTPLAGFDIQPKGLLPSGEQRPYMLYAKYGLSIVGGVARSVSGATLAIRNISHNSLIEQCKNATTGYSGKSFADDWYVKIMFLLKYATKNSQSIFAGCTSHDVRGLIAVAEADTTRVIIPNAAANNLPIGSGVSLGTNDPSTTNRETARTFDIFDMRTITAKEAFDAANQAVYVSGSPFSTAVGYQVSSMPWNPGGCDAVIGDGSPSDPLSGREPFVIQGIETGLGAYETLGDVIISNTGTGWVPMLLADSKLAATAVTPNYADPGARLPATEGAWAYTLHPANAAGLLFGDKTGGSSTTGMADGSFTSAIVSLGTRQWRGLGNLADGVRAGLWCVTASLSLGSVNWSIGSRLSGVGRSAG